MVIGVMMIVAMVSGAKGYLQETTPKESVAMASDVYGQWALWWVAMLTGCYGGWCHREWVRW